MSDVKLRDRLFWYQDEDGEWAHRFYQDEHSGHILRSKYTSEVRYSDLTCGAVWSIWQIGLMWECDRDAVWVSESSDGRAPGMYGHRESVRRTYISLSFGPLYLSYQRVRPCRSLPWET